MDWLFGRKKSEGKVEDAKEATQIIDDFVMYPPVPAQPGYPASYPSLPTYPSYHTGYPGAGSSSNHAMPSLPPLNHSTKKHANPLDSVPFQLSSSLEPNGSSYIPPDVRSIGTFIANIRRAVDSSEFNYDFKLEHSVLREANAFNGL